jgi:hypothetical protein
MGGSVVKARALTSCEAVIVRLDLMTEPRTLEQRTADARHKLATDVDLWVASADAAGRAYLVPLSYVWHGGALILSTPRAGRTARNLLRAGRARVALGPTRDVVMVEGRIEERPRGADPGAEQAFTDAAGFDPRTLPDYVWLRLVPDVIQAWRSPAELPGRTVMRDERWLAP